MNNLTKLMWGALVAIAMIITSCSSDDEQIAPKAGADGFFIVNEGAFLGGNASLSYFDKAAKTMTNDVFVNATEKPLGDQAQSMTVFNDKGYIVVQNSAKIEVINTTDFTSLATITEGIASPRYFLGVTTTKGYVSDWGADGVSGTVKVIDLTTNEVVKTIPTGQGANKMVMVGDNVYVANNGGWGADNTVQVIDVSSDAIVKTIEVGDNPSSLVADQNGTIWVAGSGKTVYNVDWSVDEANSTAGFIAKIVNDEIEVSFTMPEKLSGPSNIEINSAGSSLYFDYSGSIYTMTTTGVGQGSSIDIKQFINKQFYGLELDPSTDNILGFESPSFTSSGTMYRYNSEGTQIDSYEVGIGPSSAGF